MSVCSCFSPSPRLGRGNMYDSDLEPPEILYFTDKQNRFSQEVLLGLRGQTAATQATRGSATVYFPGAQAEGLQHAPSQNFRRINSVMEPPPVNGALRKDDLWTQSRQNLEEAIEEEKESTSHRWDPDLLSHEQRLEQRLDKLNLDMYIMGSDGACQFRAVSYGLFGKEEYHKAVRRKAVKYMNEHKQDFGPFLGESFHSYMKEMGQSSSWGDELTLRALSEAYGIVINVITSDQQNWFMRYEPEVQPKNNMEVFVTYIAPIHYNAVRRKTQAARLRNMGSFSRQKSSRIQMAMDRAASQSGLEQHKRLAQQKSQAQSDAAAASGHMPAARKSFGTARPGLHGVMSGLQSVREEDSTHGEPPLAAAQNGAAPAGVAAQPAPVAAISGGENGTPQFIVEGAQQGAVIGQQQQPPGRTKPVKVPSRGRNYVYGMSTSSSPMPVLQSPFAAAAVGPV